jgi:hypothetical protein
VLLGIVRVADEDSRRHVCVGSYSKAQACKRLGGRASHAMRCEVKRKSASKPVPQVRVRLLEAKPGQGKVRTGPPNIPETSRDAHCQQSSEEGRIGLFSRPTAEKCIRRQNLGCGFRGERLRIGGLEVVLRPSPISEVKPFSPTFASQHSIMHSENKLCAITPRRD